MPESNQSPHTDNAENNSLIQSNLPIAAKLDQARTNLLDLSARNRLLNTPRSGKTARTIEVVDEKSFEIFRLLVQEERAFTFSAGRSAKKDAEEPQEGVIEEADEIWDLAQPDDDTKNERGVFLRHADTQLQTRLTSKGLQKRLLEMYTDAITLEQEQGVNILYLTLGMLRWIDPHNAANVRHAPLVLIPVQLERSSAADRFKLRWRKEDVASNLSLEAYLDREHRLKLPTFESEDFDLAAYCAAVAESVSLKANWEVLPDDIVLGFFSFAKFLMYRDLDAECWPEEESLATRPLIRGLLADGFPHQELTIPEDALIDDYISPAEMLHIADADGSQMRAVHEARQGHSIVIQGPPGTGKSQTIANIIAAAVADGKSVLFVAEKMVALSVVKARLDRAGVGDACLELHSNKANKRAVLQELKRTWELGSPHGVVRESLNDNLKRTRETLNLHAATMNTPHPVAKLTPYEVAGEIASLMQYGVTPVDFDLEQAVNWTPDDVIAREEILRNFTNRVREIGLPAEHPWRGVGLANLLPTDVGRQLQSVRRVRDGIAELHADSSVLSEAIGLARPGTFAELNEYRDVVKKIGAAPSLSEKAMTASEWAAADEWLEKLLDAGQSQGQLLVELKPILQTSASHVDLDSEIDVLRSIPGDTRLEDLDRIADAAHVLTDVIQQLPMLQRGLHLQASETDTRQDLQRILKIARGVSEAPDADAEAFSSAVWKQGLDKAESLTRAATQAEVARAAVGDKLSPAAWDRDFSEARRVLASHGTGLMRHLSGEWRNADRLVRSFLQNPKMGLTEILQILDQHSMGRKAEEELRANAEFGREAFGSGWRGDRSTSVALQAMTVWMSSLGSMREDIRMLVAANVAREEIKRRYLELQSQENRLGGLLLGLDEALSSNEYTPLSMLAALAAKIAAADAATRSPFLALPVRLHERLKRLAQWQDFQSARTILRQLDSLAASAFGEWWQGPESDWQELKKAAAWVLENGVLRYIAARFPDRNAPSSQLEPILQHLDAVEQDWHRLAEQLLSSHDTLFPKASFLMTPVHALLARLDGWLNNGEQLSSWVLFQSSDRQLRTSGLAAVADRVCEQQWTSEMAQANFAMGYYEAILRDLLHRSSDLASFDGKNHSDLVERFRSLDKERISASAVEVVRAHHRRIPVGGGIGPVGVLRGEIAKKSRHLPLRQLMSKAAPVIQALKPVLMMSPLSIAQFLPPGKISFDLLVMDEASQIQPVDALGAIARCRQIVVVGDERQLPPTRFFAKMTSDADESEEDEEDTTRVGDVESILGLFIARGLPQRMLRWHYRSRHQSLIAVSNSEFYENKLFIIPSPHTQGAGRGLRFYLVPDGIFYSAAKESESRFGNPVEARVVAEAVLRHALEHPDRSLGVATFSVTQRRAILEQIERLRRLNPECEAFFNGHPTEPFFVKNLENVQGDERDTIFISVGYGRNPQGQFPMRFGPLGMDGGERRLNVLISRAKLECVVYASITDEDIDIERAKGRGVFALKLFLHFARTGKLSMTKSVEVAERKSAFAHQAGQALAGQGLTVHENVGVAGCFIDLAVQDPERPSRYLMGIEFDGPDYSRSVSSRDRDRLRRSVLEDHGWTMHRVWSLDWLHRPQEQLAACLETLASSRSADAEELIEANRLTNATLEIVTIEREEGIGMGLSVGSLGDDSAYVEAVLSPPVSIEFHATPTGILAKCVCDIVCVEGPIHEDEVTSRLRSMWGLARSGQRIQEVATRAISHAAVQKMIERDGSFLSLPGQKPRVRDRSAVRSPSLRRPEMISPREIEVAILHTVQMSFGGSEEEISTTVARSLGFQAKSALLHATVVAVLSEMSKKGRVRSVGNLWVATAESLSTDQENAAHTVKRE